MQRNKDYNQYVDKILAKACTRRHHTAHTRQMMEMDYTALERK